MAELNRQLSRNSPEYNTTASQGAKVCKPNIQFVLGAVIIHKVPYKPDVNKYLGVVNGKDKFELDDTNSENFINAQKQGSFVNRLNYPTEYNHYFYPMTNGKTGQEGGLNGRAVPGEGITIGYGAWANYLTDQKNNPSPTNQVWSFQAEAKTILHEFFHTLGLDHPFDDETGDRCDDTHDQKPRCWLCIQPDPNATNNIMGYNPAIDWSLSPCQLCKIHQALENNARVKYAGNCARGKALFYIPSEICYYKGFGATLIMQGVSSNETRYKIDIAEVDHPGVRTPVAGTLKSQQFTGEIGKTNVTSKLGYSFKPGKFYYIKLRVENENCPPPDEAEAWVKVKDCSANDLDHPIPNEDAIRALSLYPNPTSDILNIEYDVLRSIDTKIDVIDIWSNQVVFQIKDRSQEEIGAKLLTRDLPYEIPSGQYAIRFITSEAVLTQSLFIVR